MTRQRPEPVRLNPLSAVVEYRTLTVTRDGSGHISVTMGRLDTASNRMVFEGIDRWMQPPDVPFSALQEIHDAAAYLLQRDAEAHQPRLPMPPPEA